MLAPMPANARVACASTAYAASVVLKGENRAQGPGKHKSENEVTLATPNAPRRKARLPRVRAPASKASSFRDSPGESLMNFPAAAPPRRTPAAMDPAEYQPATTPASERSPQLVPAPSPALIQARCGQEFVDA
jgi:hypothetical protein